MNTKRTNVKSLNSGDRFVIPGIDTVYVCDGRRTMGNMTTVDYHVDVYHALNCFTFTRVNLSSVDVVV